MPSSNLTGYLKNLSMLNAIKKILGAYSETDDGCAY